MLASGADKSYQYALNRQFYGTATEANLSVNRNSDAQNRDEQNDDTRHNEDNRIKTNGSYGNESD